MSIFKFLRDAQYGLRGVRVGEVGYPGPHNLVFRWTRRVSTASTVLPTVVDVTSTEESNMPATHPLTNVNGTDSVASSVFLNMFEADRGGRIRFHPETFSSNDTFIQNTFIQF